MRDPKITLLAVALCLCSSLTRVVALSQIQAIWQFSGPCYPVPDSTLVQIIGSALNPLTNVPWGNYQQSGGFTSLCTKLSIPDCTAANTIKIGSRRRLFLADTTTACTNKYWFMYMDTTQPVGLSTYDPNAIMDRVKQISQDGSFLQALSATPLGAQTVSLRLLQEFQLPDTSPPPVDNSNSTSTWNSTSSSDSGNSSSSRSSSSGGGNLALPTDAGSSSTSSSSASSVNSQPPPPPPSPTPIPSSSSSSSNGFVYISNSGSGGSSSSSNGSSSLSKPVVIIIVIASVAAAATIAGLVGALMLRKRTQRQAQARIQADLEEHRRKRDMRRSVSMSQRSTFSEKMGSSMARRHEQDLPSAPPASITVVAAPDRGSELDTVLDASQARSAQPEIPPHERKRRFLGLF